MIRSLVITAVAGMVVSVICFATAAVIAGPELMGDPFSWSQRLQAVIDGWFGLPR